MRRVVLCAALLGIACDSPPAAPSVDFEFAVATTDSLGTPFRVDRVSWYLPPVEGLAEHHEGVCADEGCTLWRWDLLPEGQFYVETIWTAPFPPDPACHFTAYDARPLTREPGQRLLVTLQLQALLLCE